MLNPQTTAELFELHMRVETLIEGLGDHLPRLHRLIEGEPRSELDRFILRVAAAVAFREALVAAGEKRRKHGDDKLTKVGTVHTLDGTNL